MLCYAGLGKGLENVLDTDELVNEEDIAAALQQPAPSKGRRGGNKGQAGRSSVTPDRQAASELLGRSDSLSARERNKLKRKAKAMERQGSTRGDSKGRVRMPCAVQFELTHQTQPHAVGMNAQQLG